MRTERLLNEWLAAWLQREETRDEATERVTEIFDTTQPPDSVTGTPPLSAHIRERHETRSDSTATDCEAHSRTDEATQTDIEAETSGESEAESREEKGADKTLVWVSIALSLVSLAVIAIIIKHRSNRH